jgi:hypothetical protein
VNVCSFERCGRKAVARGLCNSHDAQRRRGHELQPIGFARARRPCAFEGCLNNATSRGLCTGHRKQQRKGIALARLRRHDDPRAVNEVVIEGEAAYLILTDRHGVEVGRALIDAEDVPLVAARKWYLHSKSGYVTTGDGGLLHRVVMAAPDGMEVDHEQAVLTDCRKAGLRLVTRVQNMQNVVMRGRARDRNVYYCPEGNSEAKPWKAQIRSGGRCVFTRWCATADEARGAAREARASLFTHANEERHK